MRTFVFGTTDSAWITRHGGVDAGDGRIAVQVPADQIEEITICSRPWLRHRFADCPSDAPNPSILCPAMWAA